jgi:hypothetical protein
VTTTLSGTDAFLDVVCGDEDWVRAEFDAIVEANWPPAGRPEPPVPSPGPRRTSRRPTGRSRPVPGIRPNGPAPARQRAPPDPLG